MDVPTVLMQVRPDIILEIVSIQIISVDWYRTRLCSMQSLAAACRILISAIYWVSYVIHNLDHDNFLTGRKISRTLHTIDHSTTFDYLHNSAKSSVLVHHNICNIRPKLPVYLERRSGSALSGRLIRAYH